MDELDIFIAVVENKGFSSAANALDLTTASVSRRIKSLESRLGVRLLQRTSRTISLTEAGQYYYDEVKKVRLDLSVAEDQLQSMISEPAGNFRIAAPMSFGIKTLSPLISRFAKQHPKLRIQLMLDDREANLIEDNIDLALRIAYPSDSSFIAKPIKPVPRYLCASPDYLKKNGVPKKPTDLLEHDCLHYNVISETEEWTFDCKKRSETIAVKGVFCSNNGDVLLQAAIDGMGITLLPDFLTDDAISKGKLVKILEGQERSPLTLFALYPSRHYLPIKTRLFLDYIVGALN